MTAALLGFAVIVVGELPTRFDVVEAIQYRFVFTPDSKALVAAHSDDCGVRLVPIEGAPRELLPPCKDLTPQGDRPAVSNTRIAFCSRRGDGAVDVIDFDSDRPAPRILKLNPNGIYAAALSPDGSVGVIIGRGKTTGKDELTLWSATTGEVLARRQGSFDNEGPVGVSRDAQLQMSPDGRHLLIDRLVRGKPAVALYELPSLTPLPRFPAQVEMAAFSADGAFIWASRAGAKGPRVGKYDAANGKLLEEPQTQCSELLAAGVQGAQTWITCQRFARTVSPDGTLSLVEKDKGKSWSIVRTSDHAELQVIPMTRSRTQTTDWPSVLGKYRAHTVNTQAQIGSSCTATVELAEADGGIEGTLVVSEESDGKRSTWEYQLVPVELDHQHFRAGLRLRREERPRPGVSPFAGGDFYVERSGPGNWALRAPSRNFSLPCLDDPWGYRPVRE